MFNEIQQENRLRGIKNTQLFQHREVDVLITNYKQTKGRKTDGAQQLTKYQKMHT